MVETTQKYLNWAQIGEEELKLNTAKKSKEE